MTSCLCDSVDYPTLYNKRLVAKARTPHKCTECWGTIQPGEPYERVSGVWDGDFKTFRTCSRCVNLRDAVDVLFPCMCWTYGNVIQDTREKISEYESDLVGTGELFRIGRLLVTIRKGKENGKTKVEVCDD